MELYNRKGDNVILRKPYAFLVKHFKLIHVGLTLIIAFLVYRTNMLLTFLNEYINSNQTSVSDNIVNTMFNIWMFIFPFLIIVLSLIIISVMSLKKKPIFLYIFNITLAAAILVLYNLSHSMFTQMETVLLEIRTVRLFRDFITILELFQCASLITALIRATGFDIKKFNFKDDLEELEITEEDNEEFEVNLEVNTNEVQRKANRFKRISKYIYYENKFLFDVGLLIVFSTICFIFYMNAGIYDRDVKQNTIFATTSFHLGVTESYITNKDYKGKQLLDNDEMLVVLELKIKSKGYDKKLETAIINLEVANKKFYHVANYKDGLMDLGETYQDALISTSFEKHLLVFKIPKKYAKEEMIFTYTDRIDYISSGVNSKYIRVKIVPEFVDKGRDEFAANIENDLNLEKSVLKKSKMVIETAEIKKEFRETYNFCVNETECFPSAEFIKPNYNSNDEKAILKLRGTLELDSEVVLNRVYSLYHFIYYFGTLKYEKGDQIITGKVTLNRIKPSKFKPKDTYYIEVSADTMNADKIWLQFHIRNKEYLYQIK